MSEKQSFIIHLDSLAIFEEMTNDQKGELFEAIRQYHLGNQFELSPLIKIIFIPFKNQFDRDGLKYDKIVERNKLNGAKGGRPKSKEVESQNNPVGFEKTKPNPKNLDNDSDSDNDNESDNDNDSDSDHNLFGADAQKKDQGKIAEEKSEGKEKSSAKNEFEKFGKAEFRQTLLDLGVDPQHVEDWIKVRIAKRAGFTASALHLIIEECTKHNLPIAEAIKMCAGKSWQGFKYQWYINEINNGKQPTNTANQSRQQRVEEVAEFRRTNQQSIIERLQKYTSGDLN